MRCRPEDAVAECVEMRRILEMTLKHPVISFGYPNGYSPAYDADGDYVLRAAKAAGYWSGRTTRVEHQVIGEISEPLTLDSDGFFGNAKDLERHWAITQTKEGGVFYFWGHSWQIGKTEEQWQKFSDFVAQFAKHPDAWYPSQGEFSIWLWLRKNVSFQVISQDPSRIVVQISRPWLHPYLSAQCPLSFRVPEGVEKVVWQGKEIAVVNGLVEVIW